MKCPSRGIHMIRDLNQGQTKKIFLTWLTETKNDIEVKIICEFLFAMSSYKSQYLSMLKIKFEYYGGYVDGSM